MRERERGNYEKDLVVVQSREDERGGRERFSK